MNDLLLQRRSNGRRDECDDKKQKELGHSIKHFPELRSSKSIHMASEHPMIFWGVVIFSQVLGVLSIGLVAYFGWLNGKYAWSSDANLQFNWHPLCMVIGLVFLYGDAIIIYRVFSFLPKKLLKIMHGILHVSAILFASIGIAAVFENHRRTNKADLYSLHSWVGIVTFIFFCLQYIGGFATFLYPGLPDGLRAKIMPFHLFMGLALFVLSVGTAQMGLTEKLLWTKNYSSGLFPVAGIVGNISGLAIIIFAITIIYLSTRAAYKRQPLPNENPHAGIQ